MNEDFVPFELAVKLKEKGFNYPCIGHYFNNQLYIAHYQNAFHSDKNETFDAPAISQVLKWLRERYFIHISTKPYPCEDGIMWAYEIRKFSEYISAVVAKKAGFIKEEQAAVAGIECVLDNLI